MFEWSQAAEKKTACPGKEHAKQKVHVARLCVLREAQPRGDRITLAVAVRGEMTDQTADLFSARRVMIPRWPIAKTGSVSVALITAGVPSDRAQRL